MYTNTNASELNSVKISTLTSEDASSNTKSIECREHEWEYCTRTTGSNVFIVVHIVTHLGSGNNILCY